MLTTGPNLGLLDNGEYGEGDYSELLRLLRALDLLVQAHVISNSLTIPPSSPTEGNAYIVPSGATGEWSTKVNQIARWTSRSAAVTPQWEYFTPKKMWLFGVDDLDGYVRFDGVAWVVWGA